MREQQLYLERRDVAAEITRRHGFEITPFESFIAQISIMLDHEDFKNQAMTLWNAYNRTSDDVARQIAMDEAADLIGKCRRAMYGNDLVDRLSVRSPYTNVGAEVGGEDPYARYAYKLRLEDVALLQEWKAQIDTITENVRHTLEHPQSNPELHATITRIIGTQPAEDHIARFTIAYFLNAKRSKWRRILTPAKALKAWFFGQLNHITNLGQQMDFCADMAILAKLLSDEYGQMSVIVNASKDGDEAAGKSLHQYLQYPDGAIFDPYLLPHLHGYLPDSNRYEEEVRESGQNIKVL